MLRAGAPLIVETMHRDRLARMFTARTWSRLPSDALFLEEREADWTAGTLSALHLVIRPDGERIERRFVHRVYTVKEWI